MTWRIAPDYPSPIEGLMRAYTDDTYIVAFKCHEGKSDSMIHVLIFRIDCQSIAGWDELQRIKNEIFGETVWAYEVYPAEDCKVSTANVRHLWIRLSGPFDFGYRFRATDVNDPKLREPAKVVW